MPRTISGRTTPCSAPTWAIREGALDAFLHQVLAGLATGGIYASVALALVMIYQATHLVNFAQGEIMMLGAFMSVTFITTLGLNYWLSFLLCVIAMAILGAIMERLVLRPILGYPQFSIVMATIGLGLVIRALVGIIWGTDDLRIETPFTDGVFTIGKLVIAWDALSIIVATILLCGALYAFFRYTRVGIAMQATSQNMLAAYYMGIPVKRLNGLVWGLAAAVAAIAGMLLAPITFVHANMGFIGLKAFPAAVVGGFGSLPGAIVGGLVIGIVESFAGFYLPDGFKDTAPYIVVLLMLMIKPNGLFGEKLRKKV